jgi:hypothetical protein
VKIRKFNSKEDLRDFIIVMLLLWFLIPVMGQTTFWLAGSINYLWATVFVLAFLLPYRYLLENTHIIKNSLTSAILMFFLGILAGWSQENAAVTAIAFVGISLLFVMYKYKKLPYWFISGGLGLIIGALYLLLAPGNGVRKKNMYFDLSLKDQIMNFLQSFKYIVFHEQIAVFILILLLFIFMWVIKSHVEVKIIGLAMLFFVCGFVSYLAMIASPEFPLRATFVGVICIIISIMLLVRYINQKLLALIIMLSVIPFLVSTVNMYNDYKTVGKENTQRIQVVENSIKNGNYDVQLPAYSIKGSARVFIFDITSNPKYTSNEHFSKFYGLNSVVLDTPILVVELKEPVINQYQLYYDTGNGFNESETSYAGIYNQTDGKSLYFNLPNKPIYKFRLDPGNHVNETIQITKMSIENKNKNIKLNYDSGQLMEILHPQHDIASIEDKGEYLELTTKGDDPQLEFVNDYTDKGTEIIINFGSKLTEEIQIFYDLGKGFNENNSKIINLNNDSSLIAQLPAKNIHNLRIDLGNKPGVEIGIESITIQSTEKLKIDNVFGAADSLIQLEKGGSENNIDYFITRGSDPSFQITDLDNRLDN